MLNWVTAGDLNTDDTFIQNVIQNKIGLPSCQYLLGNKFAKETQQPDLNN